MSPTIRKQLFRAAVMAISWLLATGVTRAELELKLKLLHTSLIEYEPAMAIVTVVNDSDYPVITDPDDPNFDTRLDIEITRQGRYKSTRLRKDPAISDLRLPADEKRNMMIDISRWYDIAGMGRYVARIRAVRNGETILSNSVLFDVVHGLEIKKIRRALPGYPDRIRTYSLRYWHRDDDEFLFLTVSEENTGYNYGTFKLGRLLRINPPEMEVDRTGKVRIVHQSGNERFLESTFMSHPDEMRFIDQRTIKLKPANLREELLLPPDNE